MKSVRAVVCASALAASAGAPGIVCAIEPAAPPGADARIEAHSADLLAVALVRADRMTIHLSQRIDNAPVHEASVTVTLRGTAHPTIAEADGSYMLQSTDLTLPGTATIQFHIARPQGREDLQGTLERTVNEKPQDKNSARQLWWWVLNFAVCIGFLWLLSRRRKTAES